MRPKQVELLLYLFHFFKNKILQYAVIFEDFITLYHLSSKINFDSRLYQFHKCIPLKDCIRVVGFAHHACRALDCGQFQS